MWKRPALRPATRQQFNQRPEVRSEAHPEPSIAKEEPMRRRSDSTSYPFSVFTPEFLRYLEGFDEPVTAAEADMTGPFRIEAAPDGGFAVMRPGHSLVRGDEPEGFFFRVEHALQIAAIL